VDRGALTLAKELAVPLRRQLGGRGGKGGGAVRIYQRRNRDDL